MAIITAAGLTDLYNQRTFNKNGTTITLKKISETEWLLFGDLAEGDSGGFPEKPYEVNLSPFSLFEDFYLDSEVWYFVSENPFTFNPEDYLLPSVIQEKRDDVSSWFTKEGMGDMISGFPLLSLQWAPTTDELISPLPAGVSEVALQMRYASPATSENPVTGFDGCFFLGHVIFDSSEIFFSPYTVAWDADASVINDMADFFAQKYTEVFNSETNSWIVSDSGWDDNWGLVSVEMVSTILQNPGVLEKIRYRGGSVA